MMDHAGMLARYKRIRKVGEHLAGKLLKTIPKPTITESARRLGLLARDTLVFDSEHEGAILMDYAIHSHRAGGRTVLERYAAESPSPEDPDEAALFEALGKARFSIFAVTRVDKGLGVEVEDVLAADTADTIFVMDIGFSRSGMPGMALAARLVPLPDFHMTTGAALPILPGMLPEIQKRIAARFGPSQVRKLAKLSRNERSTLEAIIIRACLRSGASRYVRYE